MSVVGIMPKSTTGGSSLARRLWTTAPLIRFPAFTESSTGRSVIPSSCQSAAAHRWLAIALGPPRRIAAMTRWCHEAGTGLGTYTPAWTACQ